MGNEKLGQGLLIASAVILIVTSVYLVYLEKSPDPESPEFYYSETYINFDNMTQAGISEARAMVDQIHPIFLSKIKHLNFTGDKNRCERVLDMESCYGYSDENYVVTEYHRTEKAPEYSKELNAVNRLHVCHEILHHYYKHTEHSDTKDVTHMALSVSASDQNCFRAEEYNPYKTLTWEDQIELVENKTGKIVYDYPAPEKYEK